MVIQSKSLISLRGEKEDQGGEAIFLMLSGLMMELGREHQHGNSSHLYGFIILFPFSSFHTDHPPTLLPFARPEKRSWSKFSQSVTDCLLPGRKFKSGHCSQEAFVGCSNAHCGRDHSYRSSCSPKCSQLERGLTCPTSCSDRTGFESLNGVCPNFSFCINTPGR